MVVSLVAVMALPAMADQTGQDQLKNLKTGSHNISTAWVDVMDTTHEEASKGKSVHEQMTGLVAGGAIGVRKVIHRVGAGVIDVVTFWIPKKQPIISPEQARLAS